MSTTLVTALYNIGRDDLQGQYAYRSFSKYLDWFRNLLVINAPMVIFIPDYLQEYVLQHRSPHYSTKIIIRNFEELDAYKHHDRIQLTIDNMIRTPSINGMIPSYFNDCPEFITAKYETIIFSKFDFLKEVSDDNPFNTNYFIWLDAGTFYNEPPFNYKLEWPDPYKIKTLGDKFLVANYNNFNKYDTSPLTDKYSYLRLNENRICAYILGGNKYAIDTIHERFWNEVNSALDNGVINNEQHFLQLMILQNPDDYYCWYQTGSQYPNLAIPLRNRMIPFELAVGTHMGENYSINPNIKLLTIASQEITNNLYYRWESTAKYYGYDYTVLGREQRWVGFNTKIKLYYDALKHLHTPYVVMTDCIDGFFTGSSYELNDKFLLLNTDLIIGAEMKMYYPGGKNNHQSVKEYFESIKQSPQIFPNSGFLMGRTSEMLKLMELHLSYKDDQVACFDTIYENKLPISLDYKTDLIGNVPRYLGGGGTEAIDYFEYDPDINRYRNKLHNTLPLFFHFPGKNMYVMQQFYSTTHPNLVVKDTSAHNSGWIFLIILIVFIIFLVILQFFRNNY